MFPLCKSTGISSDHQISNIKRKHQPEDEAELWNISTKSSVETDLPRWDLWRPPHALKRLPQGSVRLLAKEKRVRFCEETSIQATVTPALFRKSVSQQGWAHTAWGKTVVTGRQQPNENTISSTESVNVPEIWSPTRHRRIHPSAIKDTIRFTVERCFECIFFFSPAAQQSFKCICSFRVSYLVKSNSGQIQSFECKYLKSRNFWTFLDFELSHSESARLTLSHAELTVHGFGDPLLSFVKLDNIHFSYHRPLDRSFIANWIRLSSYDIWCVFELRHVSPLALMLWCVAFVHPFWIQRTTVTSLSLMEEYLMQHNSNTL